MRSRTPRTDSRPRDARVGAGDRSGARPGSVLPALVRRGALVAFLLWILGSAGCSLIPVQIPSGHPVPDRENLARLEREVFEQVNAYRASHGLGRLRIEPALEKIARKHCRSMALGECSFGHTGFEARVRQARASLPIGDFAENVAMNNYPVALVARTALESWIRSPAHRAEMEGAYELTGVGVDCSASGDYFVTQLYAASRK